MTDTVTQALRLDGYNGAISQAIRALRYLAENSRPTEGERFPNSACCYQVASELERTQREFEPAITAWNTRDGGAATPMRLAGTASSVDVDPSKMSVEMAELFGLVCKLSRLRTEHDDALRSNTGHLEAIEQAANKVDQIVDAIPELKAVFAKVHERERQMRAALANTPAASGVGADAADLLAHYADFIRHSVKADDLEMHPYLPEIERVVYDLRAAIAKATVAESDAPETSGEAGQ